ncbi:MAG TPA: outer membrane beta-barrel protein [Allosphingosinicella sp.]|jgi:outer membrane immunogenic protein
MKASFLIAAAAAALAIQPAGAALAEAEPASPDRAAAETSGFRAEALAGFDNDGFDHGMLYGGRLGYDLRVAPRLLLGIDAEYSDVTTDEEFAFPGLPSLTAEDGPEYYVGGRATFVLSKRFRLFGAGGYTRGKQGFFFQSDPNPAPLGTVASGRRSLDGFRLSAGGQVLLGRHAFLGAEYRYSNYDDFGLDREQLVGSIGFRF